MSGRGCSSTAFALLRSTLGSRARQDLARKWRCCCCCCAVSCRGVMSYLQVVGEQHHQVENHMAAFTTRVAELRAKHNLLLPGTIEVCWHQTIRGRFPVLCA